MTTIRPFATRGEAAYWGGGVLAEDVSGGWWSLHAVTYPCGVETYAVGRDGRTPWPKTLKRRHVFATPDDGGAKCICIRD